MMSDTAKSSQTQITTANTSSNPALVAPKDTTPTIAPVATTQPEVWTGEITLKPKNADKFQYSVSTKIYESSTIGKVRIDFKNTPSDSRNPTMFIVNKNLKYNDNSKKFNDMLGLIKDGENFKNENGKGYLDVQNVNIDKFNNPNTEDTTKYITGLTTEFLFTTTSEAYGLTPKLYPIKQIEYKGVDKAVVVATTGGVNILAVKGDNLIRLTSKYKSDKPLASEENTNLCNSKNLGQGPETEKCYAIGLINNPDLEKIINDTAQELLATFAL